MAPELAIVGLKALKHQTVVLDPMVGSGTVVRHASELGHQAIGFDLDPLAILMSKVWTTPIDDAVIAQFADELLSKVNDLTDPVYLPWVDEDEETKKFIDYWFAEPQCSDLRRIAFALSQSDQLSLCAQKRAAANVLRIALSRIIITKDQGASLARDVSHSRPHKVANTSAFEVIPEFKRSILYVRRLLANAPPIGNVDIRIGDARSLKSVENGSIGAVLTSPPYLNAIDYMRGHRLSLVWLGHRLSDLRNIRSNSVGAERSIEQNLSTHLFGPILDAMCPLDDLTHRHASMVARYAEDMYRLMSEAARVLEPEGRAIFVVGNSCLRGVFIRNSEGLIKAGSMVGLRLLSQAERELPNRNRYLPMPARTDEPLGKRMRTESVLTFVHM